MYQIEELRSDGTVFLLPPQDVKIGIIPASTFLFQNYPNPFNAQTTIVYGIPSRSRVSLRLYDILGRLVRTLAEGEQEPGEYEVLWDGTGETGQDAASGVGTEGSIQKGSCPRMKPAICWISDHLSRETGGEAKDH